jgi:hypothetical protein
LKKDFKIGTFFKFIPDFQRWSEEKKRKLMMTHIFFARLMMTHIEKEVCASFFFVGRE